MKKKLYEFTEALTIDQTSEYLSLVFGQVVKNSDVFKLVLDGHLKISVEFGSVTARYGKLLHVEEGRTPPYPRNHLKASPIGGNSGAFVFGEKIDVINGVWDIYMTRGAGRVLVENTYRKLRNLSALSVFFEDQATVLSLDGMTVCLLQESLEDRDDVPGTAAYAKKIVKNIVDSNLDKVDEKRLRYQALNARLAYLRRPAIERYRPARGFGDNTQLVVRFDALKDFEKTVNRNSGEEKPLETRERNTLLCIIGVLCNELGWKCEMHAKTALQIEGTASRMGVKIGETTIEGHLKKVNIALGARTK